MTATINDFEKSKEFFKRGDLFNTLESYEKVIDHMDRSKNNQKEDYIKFLNEILQYCRDQNMPEQEAMVLRVLGKTYSKFRDHVESLKYFYQAVKIQKRLGRKLDTAESLMFLSEDLQVSGNYKESILNYKEAAEIFHNLGKLRKEKEIRKEINRLENFSKEIIEDEFIRHKFKIDKY